VHLPAMTNLDGSVALVTGSARGIGASAIRTPYDDERARL
jgi:hypothetical protein